MNNSNNFKVKARIFEQLGEQLIKNENIAFTELIKNSYDADASIVNISINNIEIPEKSQIIIKDDGCGMDIDFIKNIWFDIGTDFKKTINETPKYHRQLLGEKGIGRLAIHKLGHKIEIISRSKNNKEIYLTINWNEIEQYKYIQEIPITVIERVPEIFTKDKTGTCIIISSLKNKWDYNSIENLYRSIINFNNPFNPISNFKINFNIDNINWTDNSLTFDKIKEYSLYYIEAEIEADRITKFKYEFSPYVTMNKLQKRVVNESDKQVAKLLKMVNKNNISINLNNYQLGPIKFSAYIFDRESKILKLGLCNINGLKEYLVENGGIRIYRDGIRIYDYGETENNWLEFDTEQNSALIKKINNNTIIGAIELNRKESKSLVEKTNREGFIENEAYITFKSAILYLLNIIENQINIDKNKVNLLYGIKEKSQPVIAAVDELKLSMEQEINDNDIKNKIINYLDKIKREYENTNKIFLKSAGAGLNLSVIIHEIEKILGELNKIVENGDVNERIVTLVSHLSNLVNGYSELIRCSGKKKEDIVKIINQAIFNMEYRLNYHNIKLQKEYKTYNGNNNIPVVRSLLLNSIMNIIDNSIWWLNYSKKEEKKIFINIIDKPMGYLSIVLADNGCGFALSTEEIINPFISAKPDGIGLGLHITSEIMKSHDGLLLFPNDSEIDDYDIPDDYKYGAKIVLSLKRK